MIVVLMGVAGVGKTTIGRLLAADLGWPFLDADDFHPPASVEKMSRGLPLTDADREPWLESLRGAIRERLVRGESAVLACSALKGAYRDRLRVDASVRFVHLKADPELIRRRLGQRREHFFGPDLLASQLEALEESPDGLGVDVADAPEAVARRIAHGLGLATIPPEVVVDSPEHLAETLARRLEQDAKQAIAARGRFSLALPGGSVASAFFPRLARAEVDWALTDFFWVDERAVPPEDPESNYGAAERLWLTPAGVPPARVHRMAAAAADLEAAAAAYEDEMIRVLGRPARLDVALLGMGPDGHVCSLFPGHPLLREERRLVAAVHDSPKPPARRLTLTLPVLASAVRVVVAAPGDAKAAPAREALRDPASALPVAVVLRSARRVLLLLDHGAARLL